MLEIAGLVKIPKRFRNLSLDEIIARAKQEYFKEQWLKQKKQEDRKTFDKRAFL